MMSFYPVGGAQRDLHCPQLPQIVDLIDQGNFLGILDELRDDFDRTFKAIPRDRQIKVLTGIRNLKHDYGNLSYSMFLNMIPYSSFSEEDCKAHLSIEDLSAENDQMANEEEICQRAIYFVSSKHGSNAAKEDLETLRDQLQAKSKEVPILLHQLISEKQSERCQFCVLV